MGEDYDDLFGDMSANGTNSTNAPFIYKWSNKFSYQLKRSYIRRGMRILSYRFGNVLLLPFSQFSIKHSHLSYLDDITDFGGQVTKFKYLGHKEIKINMFNMYLLNNYDSKQYNSFKLRSKIVKEHTDEKLSIESITKYKDKEEENLPWYQ